MLRGKTLHAVAVLARGPPGRKSSVAAALAYRESGLIAYQEAGDESLG